MWDFSVGRAMSLMMQTLPFVVLRMAVYFGITLAYILATGAGAGIGFGVGALGDPGFQAGSTFWGGLIGFGIVGAVMYWAREYLLYIVKAGHIAVSRPSKASSPIPNGMRGLSRCPRNSVSSRRAPLAVGRSPMPVPSLSD